MGGQADGSIIIDTELNSEGFKAGSEELLAAIKSLSAQVKTLGDTLKTVFQGNNLGQGSNGAEGQIMALQTRIQELEAELEAVRNQQISDVVSPEAESRVQELEAAVADLQQQLQQQASTGTPATPQVNTSGAASSASNLQAQLSRAEKAIAATEARLDKAKAKLQDYFKEQSAIKASTDEMLKNAETSSQVEAILELENIQLEQLNAKYAKQLADVNAITAQLQQQQQAHAAIAQQISAQSAGQSGASAGAGAAQSKAAALGAALRNATSWLGGKMASGARAVASGLGQAARIAGGALVSGLRTGLSYILRMATGGKSLGKSFGGAIGTVKKLVPALLAARGVMGILRKAVSAYMSQNQQLANTLSSCWAGIGNILGPIISRLISLVATAVSYVTQFLSLLGFVGKSTVKAIGAAGGAAGKEAKELKRQLASFDELNILNNDDSGGGGGGGGGGGAGAGDLAAAELPDWAKLVAAQLKAGQWAEAANTLTAELNRMVDTVNWAGIGDKIGYYLNGALTFLAGVITGFDWKNLGSKLATSVNHIITSVDWTNLGTVLSGKFRIVLLTAAGFLENLDWAAFAKGFSDFAIGFFNGISYALENVDWQKIGEGVKTFLKNVNWAGIAEAIAEGIGAAIGGLAALLWGLLGEAWQSVVDWWHDAAFEDGHFTIEGLLEGIGDALSNIWSWIKEHIFQPFIDGFKAAFGINSPSTVMKEQGGYIIEGLLQGISEAWHLITDFFGQMLGPLIELLSGAWETIKTNASTAWEFISQKTSEAWSSVKSYVVDNLTKAKTSASKAWNSIKTTASNVGSKVKSGASSAWSAVKGFVTNNLSKAKSNASSAWNSIKSTASSVGSRIKSDASAAWTAVKNHVSNNLSKAKSNASSAWNSIKSATSTASNNIKSTVSSGFTNIKNSIVNSLNSAKSSASSAFSGMVSSISSGVSSARNAVSSGFSSIASSVSSGVNSAKNTVANGFSGIKSSISSHLQSALNSAKNLNWKSIGSNIIQGIANGIDAGWQWLLNKVSNLASSLLKKAKNALGIKSPSRVFRDEVGYFIGLGVGEGIEDSENPVLAQVSGLADAIAGEFANEAYTLNGTVAAPEIDGALTSFSDKITDGFTVLMDRLEAIAEHVTFAAPQMAAGIVPYKAAADAATNDQISSDIIASNEELGSVFIQAITNATFAIVNAIQQYSGGNAPVIDEDFITRMVINNINRQTVMHGKSPLKA